MPTEISAQELAIKDVFHDKYRFEVPDYQRPYAWTSQETLELLSDIKNAAGDAESPDEEEPYFLGSVVLTKDRLYPEAKVIDGQQRLTTLTILLAVLRDLAQNDQLKHDLDSYIRHPETVLLVLNQLTASPNGGGIEIFSKSRFRKWEQSSVLLTDLNLESQVANECSKMPHYCIQNWQR